MSRKEEDHEEWQFLKDFHVGDPYGCYMRHSFTSPPPNYNTVKYPACDYPFHGFNIAKTAARSDMYNKDHLTRARKKGLLPNQDGKVLTGQVHAIATKRGQDKSWEDRVKQVIRKSFGLLERDAKAWHVNHTFADGEVEPWFGSEKKRTPPENFLPRPHGGWHFRYPYKHNHHHLIPNRAFRDLVLDAKPSGKADSMTRRLAILMSDWNINEDTNVILLPSELAIASVCGLPSHCPWETVEHPEYTRRIKTDLGKVRTSLDKAASTLNHKEIEKAVITLKNTEEALFKKIKNRRGAI